VVVDANGLPVRPGLTRARLMIIGSVRCFWPDCARKRLCWQIVATFVREQGAWANIPPKKNRTSPINFSPDLYRSRNLVERFFNKVKPRRRIAT
jgi:transposase